MPSFKKKINCFCHCNENDVFFLPYIFHQTALIAWCAVSRMCFVHFCVDLRMCGTLFTDSSGLKHEIALHKHLRKARTKIESVYKSRYVCTYSMLLSVHIRLVSRFRTPRTLRTFMPLHKRSTSLWISQLLLYIHWPWVILTFHNKLCRSVSVWHKNLSSVAIAQMKVCWMLSECVCIGRPVDIVWRHSSSYSTRFSWLCTFRQWVLMLRSEMRLCLYIELTQCQRWNCVSHSSFWTLFSEHNSFVLLKQIP